MRDTNKIEEGKIEHNLSVIVEGAESEYWHLLEAEIKEQIDRKQEQLKKMIRITNWGDKEIRKQQILNDQIDFMEQFLKINDHLIYRNTDAWKRLKNTIENIFKQTASFIGVRIKEEKEDAGTNTDL